jgi:hypothetical protein
LAVAGAVALSVSFAGCSSSSGNNAGTGGTTGVVTGSGGGGGMTAGTGGMTGTGGMVTDGGSDSGTTTDPHAVHLDIINKATTGGVPVNRPAPAVSYNDCKI